LLEAPERVGGVWCTSPGETLLGLAADLAPRPGCAAARRSLPVVDLVELALEAALRRDLVTLPGLVDLCAAADGRRPGRDVLLSALARWPDQPPTESYLETRVVQVLRDAGLPEFDRQVELVDDAGPIGRVDLHRAGVVIEALGKAWHVPTVDPDDFRSSRLSSAGHLVLPLTFPHVESKPAHVARAVSSALARAGG
jgi:hypothetical protein